MNIESNIVYINVENIIPNRFQPRIAFDEKALNELALSIKEHGIIQPLVVRRLLSGKYEIIAGERRYKASQIAGLDKVPVIVADLDDNASAEVALIENIQRKNLSAIEEAKSYKKLLERGYLTQEELATRLGTSQSTIANKIRLLNLADEVQDALMKELISERHARSLLQIEDKKDQVEMLNKIITNRMTVRQLDDAIKENKSLDIINISNNQFKEDYNSINQQELDNISKLMDDAKKEIDRQYNTFNIPYGEKITDEKKEVELNIKAGDLSSVINELKKLETKVKNAGFDIETEEYDFEDLYQIIIKIEK